MSKMSGKPSSASVRIVHDEEEVTLDIPRDVFAEMLAHVVMDAQQDSPSASADEGGPLDPKDGCTAEEEAPETVRVEGERKMVLHL